jgi:DNA-directed RNA polymerase subunit RPC12/RpoP
MRLAITSLFAARCPHCSSIEFRSVGARNAVEAFVQWLLEPYRCALCGRHFFLFRWQAPIGNEA